MESGTTNASDPAIAETRNVVNTDSADSFQSFVYELFEKNGILNDLRAYLRGHIVNVLKSAETGDPLPCQKNFTKRLDLTCQALNILVAEYLMRLEFSYSFSIFVSEIPLANMVFGFAKTLLENVDDSYTDMRFKDSDIWAILNYLGVQCDSGHASKIVEMYKNEKQEPLLMCILKNMPMYKENTVEPQLSLSEVSNLTSSKSMVSTETEQKRDICMPECSHYSHCNNCQNKVYKVKAAYKKKKKYLAKDVKNKESVCTSPLRTESLVRNINIMEKNLIDEMFQQLKSVYESEVKMMKVEEEKKVKRSLAIHVMQLQQKRDELEETFKTREEELERSIQHKKQFLWGLARSLREQHEHLTKAMLEVRAETERLELKENSLKTQLAEAEEILKQRGEDMRLQIASELTILENHLESMKRERESITRERSELENLKIVQNKKVEVNRTHKLDAADVHSHYDLLRNELTILKSYLESSQMQAKCVIERGTITEPSETVSLTNVALNNSQSNEKGSKNDDFDERVKMNQVINDFRKKNVNFTQSNLDEIYHGRSRDRSRSENSSEAGDNAALELELERSHEHELIQRLRDENDKLKAMVRQQQLPRPPREPVVACAPPALPRERSTSPVRPYTAPLANAVHTFNFNSSVSASNLNIGWRKGAGEELSMFSNAQPRILVPGDTLPFIGVLRDRHGNRRTSAGGSRSHMRATLAGVSKRFAAPFRERHALVAGCSGQGHGAAGVDVAVATCFMPPTAEAPASPNIVQQRPRQPLSLDNQTRDKKPKSVLREAKDELKRKDSNEEWAAAARDKSPTSVLREAKLRLRKLEIEAEAVEKSYLDFRRRQSKLRLQRTRVSQEPRDVLPQALDVTRSHSPQILDESNKNYIEAQFADLQKSVRGNFEKNIREYKTKFQDLADTHFYSKPTPADRAMPIPDAFAAERQTGGAPGNYLETPLTEFRKLYTSARHTDKSPTGSMPSDEDVSKSAIDHEHSGRHDALRKIKHNKQAELQILKQNLHKMYHSPKTDRDSAAVDVDQQVNQSYRAATEDELNLRVEVESFSEINDVKSQTQDMLLVVQSSINSRDPQVNQSYRAATEDELNLRVEVESFSEINDVKSQTQDMLLVVQSSINSRDVTAGREESDVFAAQMTIVVSPRRRRSPSPEQAAQLTRSDVLDAIFHDDTDSNNDESSEHLQLELGKEAEDDADSSAERSYGPAELSADTERYPGYTLSESPVSVPTDDDHFWET